MDSRQSAKWCKEQVLAADDNSVGTAELIDNSVTLAKFQEMTADRILGRLATDGTLQQLTPTQVVSLVQAVSWAFSQSVQFSGNVGFYGTTPVARPATSLVSVTTITGSGADGDINDSLTALKNAINNLRAALVTLGLTA
jgi:hypothetical protein